MTADQIQRALADITAEADSTIKHLKLASLCSDLCAKKLLGAGLQNEIEVDWTEVKRLANASAYANWPDVKALIDEQAKTIQIRSSYDSDERAD